MTDVDRGLVFHGARLELCGGPVMIVIVDGAIMQDVCGSQVLVQVLGRHADETVVLMAQDAQAVPTYYGPIDIVRILARMPFEAIPWRRYRFRPRRTSSWQTRLPPPQAIGACSFVGTNLSTVPG